MSPIGWCFLLSDQRVQLRPMSQRRVGRWANSRLSSWCAWIDPEKIGLGGHTMIAQRSVLVLGDDTPLSAR